LLSRCPALYPKEPSPRPSPPLPVLYRPTYVLSHPHSGTSIYWHMPANRPPGPRGSRPHLRSGSWVGRAVSPRLEASVTNARRVSVLGKCGYQSRSGRCDRGRCKGFAMGRPLEGEMGRRRMGGKSRMVAST
jgi:hypothetical protein